MDAREVISITMTWVRMSRAALLWDHICNTIPWANWKPYEEKYRRFAGTRCNTRPTINSSHRRSASTTGTWSAGVFIVACMKGLQGCVSILGSQLSLCYIMTDCNYVHKSGGKQVGAPASEIGKYTVITDTGSMIQLPLHDIGPRCLWLMTVDEQIWLEYDLIRFNPNQATNRKARGSTKLKNVATIFRLF